MNVLDFQCIVILVGAFGGLAWVIYLGGRKIEMKVKNIDGAPNQFEIIDDDGSIYFQSYESIIVRIERKTGKTFLDENKWRYSKTTSRHRNSFLGETTAQTAAKIKSGEYTLIDLNE